ncbi:hypothetical protein K3N28_12400 [Glycomyces sp. TRM65418]|uniref:hypothetical protein n=1 Tax=Glycomyces sp. TRM65418 TaxID=2867006 RepID=UPI001CE5420E|nr:hypothetical protein [Glycomyces sp. TRM65418]MCC3763867.1 hypothetical protein [Glycomyces sp. TRM65418]QZD53570.1 hypothetical protein K3N28_12330 [Glycomyces sp. TRM65418]
MALFGQFIGTWDLRVRFFDRDGAVVSDEAGVWSFGWVLDGRAVQDVLIYPRAGEDHVGARSIGTSLRRYDQVTDTWSVIWIGAVSGTQIALTARAAGDGILLEGPDVDGSPLRWTFTDITPESFHWQGRIQDTDGTWRLEQDMRARRRPEVS